MLLLYATDDFAPCAFNISDDFTIATAACLPQPLNYHFFWQLALHQEKTSRL